jgi:ribokinase
MIIVPGSINADLLFQVERLRAGETVLCPSYAFAPGGKGANQAAAAAKAGAEVQVRRACGRRRLRAGGARAVGGGGGRLRGLAVSGEADGHRGDRGGRGGENSIIVASGANLDTAAAQVADAALGPGVTVLCQNEIRSAETFAVLRRARARGARAVLNFAPASGEVPVEVLGDLDVLIVNELEGRRWPAVAGGTTRWRSPASWPAGTGSPAC